MRETIKTVDYNGRFMVIRFQTASQPEFFSLLDSIKKKIEGRAFVPGSAIWTAPPTKKNVETLKNLGFTFLNADLLDNPEGRPPDRSYLKLKIDFPRFKDLFPFQQDGVRFFEYRHGVALNGDDMGLGKTMQAIGYLALHPELRPAVVVCPATVKLNWRNEIREWTGERSQVIYGRKSEYLKEVPIYIINYDILCYENEEEKKAEAERKKDCVRRDVKYRRRYCTLEGWIDLLEKVRPRAMIVDESQMIANTTTLRSRGVTELSEAVEENNNGARIFLSGTPIRSYPSEFFTTLHLLDRATFPEEYPYLNRFCNPKHNGFGWTYKGITHEEELRRLIEPLMIRRMKTEVLKDLPPKIRSVVPLECDEVELSAYREAADEFKDWVKENITKTLEQQQHIEFLKQLAYLAKRNAVIQWIKDFLSSGQKLIVFAYHTKALDDLQHEFKDISVRIDGSTSVPNRQKAVDKFQKDAGKQLFLGQIIAAGVGITLTASSAVAFVEFGWTPADHDQAEDRANRIGQKFCVNCYYLVAEDTVEKDNVALLEFKRKITSGLLDGEQKSFFSDEERAKLEGNLGLLKFLLKSA